MLDTQRFDIARKYLLTLASGHDCMAFADDEDVVVEHYSFRFSLMPIALIANKCASHIFRKDVERTEEGKAEG